MRGHQADLSDLKEVFMVKILQDYVASGHITFDEGKMIQVFLNQHCAKLMHEKSSLFLNTRAFSITRHAPWGQLF
jgi:hypothetical protein